MIKKLLPLYFLLLTLLSTAQTDYTFISHRNIVSNGYNFWLSIPNTYEEQQEKMPVILFLHGASLCGNDLSRVRKYGCLDAISMGRDIDALVIAPQNPGGPWNPTKIVNVVNWVKEHHALDTNRIYVIGMSLGGYGTFDVVASYPEKFAAAMAICGGSSRKEFCNLTKVPLWIIHGTADRDVPISHSDRIVNAMKACGPTHLLRYTRLHGVNHSQPAKIFYLNQTYAWLLSHSKADSVRQVNKDIDLTVSLMNTAYQGINRSANTITTKENKKTIAPLTQNNALSNDSLNEIANKPVEETTTTQPKTKPSIHTVKKGDTLYAIARKYQTTVSKLCKLNHIKEESILSLGQKLKVR